MEELTRLEERIMQCIWDYQGEVPFLDLIETVKEKLNKYFYYDYHQNQSHLRSLLTLPRLLLSVSLLMHLLIVLQIRQTNDLKLPQLDISHMTLH